jgi:hypothetical protein
VPQINFHSKKDALNSEKVPQMQEKICPGIYAAVSGAWALPSPS